MRAQALIEDSSAGPAVPDRVPGALRLVGLAAVCLGVAALAAATFVLSYAGIHAIALQAGIQPRYARGYPLLIDAMLVIVLAAVLALRAASWPSRIVAWLTLVVVLAAAAAADALHATGRTLPHNAAAITAAVLPWALVFVAFVLLLSMLRHVRLRRAAGNEQHQATRGRARSEAGGAAPPLPVRNPRSRDSASFVPGLTSGLVTSAAAGAAAGVAAPDVEGPDTGSFAAVTGPDATRAAQPAENTGSQPQDTTSSQPQDNTETAGDPEEAGALPPGDRTTAHAMAAGQVGLDPGEEPDEDAGDPADDDAGDPADEDAGDPADDDMPVFHRMWSAPTPPSN